MSDRNKNIKRCAIALERIADVLEAGQTYFTKADEDLKAMGMKLDEHRIDQVEGVDIGIECPNCDWSKVHPVMDHGGPVGLLQCDDCGHCFDDPRPDSPLFPPEIREPSFDEKVRMNEDG